MVYINEWFPNPTGNDNAGEFIELYNSASQPVNLSGYSLNDGAKKEFSLSGYDIAARGYLTLKKSQSKLALKNTDGGLLLYGPDRQVVDQANFLGAAPEGKSYSRVDYSLAKIGHFAFSYPTPGTQNKPFDNAVVTKNYPTGISLSHHLSIPSFILLVSGVASSLLLLFIYVTRTNRNISNIVFGRDEKTRL